MRKLIKTDGSVQLLGFRQTTMQLRAMIGADCLDTVILKDRVHVMLVDDAGHAKGLPVNPKATEIYYEKCGGPNPHQIRGDVVIVPDEDFA